MSNVRYAAIVAYRKKHRENDLCRDCSSPVYFDSILCEKHLLARRTYHREKRGIEEWQPGGRGRPPIEANYKKKRRSR